MRSSPGPPTGTQDGPIPRTSQGRHQELRQAPWPDVLPVAGRGLSCRSCDRRAPSQSDRDLPARSRLPVAGIVGAILHELLGPILTSPESRREELNPRSAPLPRRQRLARRSFAPRTVTWPNSSTRSTPANAFVSPKACVTARAPIDGGACQVPTVGSSSGLRRSGCPSPQGVRRRVRSRADQGKRACRLQRRSRSGA